MRSRGSMECSAGVSHAEGYDLRIGLCSNLCGIGIVSVQEKAAVNPQSTNPASAANANGPNPIPLLIRAVFVETIRRREFYVLLLFMGLFLLGAGVSRIGGIKDPATATFLLNLGLTMSYSFALLLTLLTAARQFPDELE